MRLLHLHKLIIFNNSTFTLSHFHTKKRVEVLCMLKINSTFAVEKIHGKYKCNF